MRRCNTQPEPNLRRKQRPKLLMYLASDCTTIVQIGTFAPRIPQAKARCLLCGSAVTTGSVYCAKCVPDVNRENLLRQAKSGQIATHSAIAEARRSATQAKQAEALRRWDPATLPKWLDEDFYRREIIPRLSNLTVKRIRLAIDVSHPYADLIRKGERIPHPRHWMPLAKLAGCQGKE